MIGLMSIFHLSVSNPKTVTGHGINYTLPYPRDIIFTLLSLHSFLLRSLNIGRHIQKEKLSEGMEAGKEKCGPATPRWTSLGSEIQN